MESSANAERHLLLKRGESHAASARKLDDGEKNAALSSGPEESSPKISAAPFVASSLMPSFLTQAPSVDSSPHPSSAPSNAPMPKSPFPKDREIDFGFGGVDFSRRAYRVADGPGGEYVEIIPQAADDASFLFIEIGPDFDLLLKMFAFEDFLSSALTPIQIEIPNKMLPLENISTLFTQET